MLNPDYTWGWGDGGGGQSDHITMKATEMGRAMDPGVLVGSGFQKQKDRTGSGIKNEVGSGLEHQDAKLFEIKFFFQYILIKK